MKLVYIAGPYRSNKGEYFVQVNIMRAMAAGRAIIKAGGYPVIPHGNTAHLGGFDIPDKRFLDGGLALMKRCDAVFFLPTWKTSAGAKQERKVAVADGMTIFDDMEELREWLKSE